MTAGYPKDVMLLVLKAEGSLQLTSVQERGSSEGTISRPVRLPLMHVGQETFEKVFPSRQVAVRYHWL